MQCTTQFFTKSLKYFLCILLVVMFVVASGPVVAQDGGEITAVSGVATDEGVEFPSEIPAGMVELTFENNRSEGEFGPIIGRLNDGVTMDDFFAAFASENSLEAVFLVTLFGGSNIASGESLTYTTSFPAGDYLLLELSEESEAPPIAFTVTENDAEQPAEPEADVNVALIDFGIGIPSRISAGSHVWNIQNYGEQWHELVVMKAPEGMEDITVHDLYSEEEEEGGEQILFWAPMSSGVEAWTTVDLEPGTYVVMCFLPDIVGDFSPHFEHGMVQIFIVE